MTDERWLRPSKLLRFVLLCGWLAIASPPWSGAVAEERTDTALIVAVDGSESVDDVRFGLQMQGIAAALQDREVINAIIGGPLGSIHLSLVIWSDRSSISIPWTKISSESDARDVARRVRNLPRQGGEFTCLARMLHNLTETLLVTLPAVPNRIVVDVSGDGVDNCGTNDDVEISRKSLVDRGITINGLPIITKPGEIVGTGAYRAPGNPMEPLPAPKNDDFLTIDTWYQRKVIGGFGSFVVPAHGYEDFGRAMRRKFVIEISQHSQKWVDGRKASQTRLY